MTWVDTTHRQTRESYCSRTRTSTCTVRAGVEYPYCSIHVTASASLVSGVVSDVEDIDLLGVLPATVGANIAGQNEEVKVAI